MKEWKVPNDFFPDNAQFANRGRPLIRVNDEIPQLLEAAGGENVRWAILLRGGLRVVASLMTSRVGREELAKFFGRPSLKEDLAFFTRVKNGKD